MISAREAIQFIKANNCSSDTIEVNLLKARDKILAKTIYAPISWPSFTQSSVDGYALSLGDNQYNSFQIIEGMSAAGGNSDIHLLPGQALRIFTGARLPEGADTVVMQEHTQVERQRLHIHDVVLKKGMHVRLPGSDIMVHDMAMETGTLLRPAAISFLASFGITKISIYASPVVSILVTGNELQQVGEALKPGKIYESNSVGLYAALQQCGVEDVRIEYVPDRLKETIDCIAQGVTTSDVLLITGGISVGDYDFVYEAVNRIGVKQVFYKVRQRPGKPLYFGLREKTAVFGLPGNPTSALTTFYIYVAPYIAAMQGLPNPISKTKAVLQHDVAVPSHLTCFLKGIYQNGQALALSGQESYKMKSYASANCLIEIPEHTADTKAGDEVTIYLLPNH